MNSEIANLPVPEFKPGDLVEFCWDGRWNPGWLIALPCDSFPFYVVIRHRADAHEGKGWWLRPEHVRSALQVEPDG